MKNRILPKLDLNVTNRCNFRCIHCAFDSGIVGMEELSLREIEGILRDTKDIGGQRFDITGGEPLVRDDIEGIIKLGKSLDYKIELVTNGSLLTSEMLARFKSLGLDGIAISLDGSNEEVYSSIRNVEGDIFDRVVRNIQEVRKTGFYTKINTTVFASNLSDVVNITKLALDWEVDEHGLYYFTPVGRGDRSKEFAVEPLKWLEFVNTKLVPFSDLGMKISLEFPLVERGYWAKGFGCIANRERSHLQVLPDGNVYPCAILASYGKPVANLRECSVKDVWNNKKLWKDYWGNLLELFNAHGGYCVDFNGAFDMNGYDIERYGWVCPLRKFELAEIEKWAEN